jgi:ABC-type phosphate transport system auxiliary subunit
MSENLKKRIFSYVIQGFILEYDYINETDIRRLESYLELLRFRKRKYDNEVRLKSLLTYTINLLKDT